MTELTAGQRSHAWQSHRERCVEMAIRTGVTPGGVLGLAAEISSYIVTKSTDEKEIEDRIAKEAPDGEAAA